jgi:hypothetical protein
MDRAFDRVEEKELLSFLQLLNIRSIPMQLTYYTDYLSESRYTSQSSLNRMGNISGLAGRYGTSRNHLVGVVHNLDMPVSSRATAASGEE